MGIVSINEDGLQRQNYNMFLNARGILFRIFVVFS